MRTSWAWILTAALLASGCTAAPSWRQVALGDLRPSALVTAGNDLLIGGAASDGPRLTRLDPAGNRSDFTLTADGPEAAAAGLVQLAVHGDQVQALGKMISGAHSNPRWTVWDGSLADHSLASHPQEFFTFGGHDAGPLLGASWVAGEKVILGSRTTATGARAAFYQSTGQTWNEVADRPAELASTKSSQLGFSALASTGDQLLIAGDEVVLSQPLQQHPLLWVGRPGGAWSRLELATSTAAGAGLVRAQALACAAAGDGCWVAGWAHGQLLAWSVTAGDHPSAASPEQPAGGDSGDGSGAGSSGGVDPVPQLTLWQGRPVLAGNGADSGVFVRCDAGWRRLALPGQGGEVSALAAVGERLYVLLGGTTLWVTDHTTC